ncbi:hypothetical protein [Thermococcus sp.]|uniref:hypothetical protein n=1 Tax=Thermococcus sp. TaxID=35749 RepID=UPI002623B1C3|nr:hypothetical protein [Thermococcus sp.]
MGALDAFSKAFSLVGDNKRIYFLVLGVTLFLNALNTFLFRSSNQVPIHENISSNVIFEQYGARPETFLTHDVRFVLLKLLITIVLLSFVQYSSVKAYFLSLEDKEYSMSQLFVSALVKVPAVILINLLAYVVTLVFIVVPVAVLLFGVVTLSLGVIFLGILLFFLVFPLVLTFFALVIPAYVETEKVSAFIEALKLTLENLASSFGYGILILLLGIGVGILTAPFVAVSIALSANPLVLALVEAPFNAFLVCFLWASGVLLYRDFKGIKGRKEEFLY